ncbi:hypothetical protein F2Q68_00016293 [Brassica cretica]|uniref:Uncharacterized protein n=2 Tax=Brassica cretica TaxID=69181 RepID=A0ABQ7EVM9_BRACR|nr:hypothetical protein F2Q68_00016293 [Brassica cretica]KAF3606874.1 hypothetical protein DY000_02048725 [Brassica cretica]
MPPLLLAGQQTRPVAPNFTGEPAPPNWKEEEEEAQNICIYELEASLSKPIMEVVNHLCRDGVHSWSSEIDIPDANLAFSTTDQNSKEWIWWSYMRERGDEG